MPLSHAHRRRRQAEFLFKKKTVQVLLGIFLKGKQHFNQCHRSGQGSYWFFKKFVEAVDDNEHGF